MQRPPKILVISTAIIFVILIGIGTYFNHHSPKKAIRLQVSDQPTIGYAKAKIKVVVFEEPKCSNCKEFNAEIYPQIKKDFIDTNKIQYTVIPVCFLPGSMPAAVALLCTYSADQGYPNSPQFFAFLDYMFKNEPDEHLDWATSDALVKMAEAASPAIDLNRLRNCIEQEKFRIQIMKNTEYGKKIMGGIITTPTLYVDGVKIEELTYSNIKEQIEKSGGS